MPKRVKKVVDSGQYNLLTSGNGQVLPGDVNSLDEKFNMAARKTIAVIASSPSRASAIAGTFLHERCNLLLLAPEKEGYDAVATELKKKSRLCRTEVHRCMKDGCWEADAIIMDVAGSEEAEVASLIREVATQKVVIHISRDCPDKKLQELLPYSRVTDLPDIPPSFREVLGED